MASLYVPPIYNIEAQHNGTECLAINNTFIRRILTRLASHITSKIYPRDGLCTRISRNKILKTGRRVHLTEDSILAQLEKIFRQLRALKPPGTAVESCVGGSLYDSRIPRGSPRFGPFKSIQEFHSWLRQDLTPECLKDRQRDQDRHDLQHMLSVQDGPWPLPTFSHGDLNPCNIIVRGGTVVGIIDWEFSGWYPHYWEYTSAWFGNATRTEWQGILDKVLDHPQPEVFKMEEVRNKWWGE
ncbi:hypothetical protein B0O99DRAFT_656668 [Bisporella sp. PMI_857]|nr:hypothetical protein B0O99DRAFT_656668 [Bisporella sp. PMI_857]